MLLQGSTRSTKVADEVEVLCSYALQPSRHLNLKRRQWMDALPLVHVSSDVLVVSLDLVLDVRYVESPSQRIVTAGNDCVVLGEEAVDPGIRLLKTALEA